MSYDAMKDARSDARYDAPEEYAPATVEPDYTSPEGHHAGGGANWSVPACPRCQWGLEPDGVCLRCDGCRVCGGQVDPESFFCELCGAAPSLQLLVRKQAA